MEDVKLDQVVADQTVNLALDTIKIKKQALIFVNAKRSAEKCAEDIGKQLSKSSSQLESKYNITAEQKLELMNLSEKVKGTLSKATKQCTRLANCVKNGVAFHHAGLTQKQKDLIQDKFKEGVIKVIAATPTLAAGVDLPAFRAIIRDSKRFTRQGMSFIPVLEYMQMAGRAGRPSYDNYGEAILISKSDAESEELENRYIYGEPENIYSKLAVEPVLRFYLLSLISGNFVRTKKQIMDFFSKTFWAHQYEDMDQLESIIDKMLALLVEYDFLVSSDKKLNIKEENVVDDFVDASEYTKDKKFSATKLGNRVAELYIDPMTAFNFIEAMRRSTIHRDVFSFLHMVSYTNEIKPLLRVKVKEYDYFQERFAEFEDDLIVPIPTQFDYEYDEFIDSIKTSMFFMDWIEENDEEYLLEKYDIRPGEIKVKMDLADWLLYASIELAKILDMKDILKDLNTLRVRVKNGAKEELLPLLRIKGIGRVRARKLYRNKMHDVGAIKKADITRLKQILGERTAVMVKEQLGEKVEPVPKGKRVGQKSLSGY